MPAAIDGGLWGWILRLLGIPRQRNLTGSMCAARIAISATKANHRAALDVVPLKLWAAALATRATALVASWRYVTTTPSCRRKTASPSALLSLATRNAMGASRPGGNWRQIRLRNSGRKRPSAGSANPSHPQLQTNGMVCRHFITNLVASISAQVAAEISSSPRTSPAKQDVAKPGRRVELTPMATPPAANAAVSHPSP